MTQWRVRFVGGPWDGQTRVIDPAVCIVLSGMRMVGGGWHRKQYRYTGRADDLLLFGWEDVIVDD